MEALRLEIFNWIKEQISIHGEMLPWKLLSYGFEYKGQRIPLIGPAGIWKPQALDNCPISIATSPNSPYDDDELPDDKNFMKYCYRGTDPNHRDNILLKNVMNDQIPLIYFIGIKKGWYFTAFPVFIVKENDQNLKFTIAVEDTNLISSNMDEFSANSEEPQALYIKREYITTQVKQRVNQRSFRERVLLAYRSQCAICRLKHPELLDAAHIIEDIDPKGEPIISNGISLCKIQHAAFYKYILGISPDYKVEIRKDILMEHDGPMLKHGLIELHGNDLILPNKQDNRPNREFLDIRFRKFKPKLFIRKCKWRFQKFYLIKKIFEKMPSFAFG